MSKHTHDDDRPTFGCDACIEALHQPAIRLDVGLSATQRLTRRNRANIARGVHPATLRPLRKDETCGTCVHHHDYLYHSRRLHKCELHRLGESHSEASDIRVSWPACTKWEPTT